VGLFVCVCVCAAPARFTHPFTPPLTHQPLSLFIVTEWMELKAGADPSCPTAGAGGVRVISFWFTAAPHFITPPLTPPTCTPLYHITSHRPTQTLVRTQSTQQCDHSQEPLRRSAWRCTACRSARRLWQTCGRRRSIRGISLSIFGQPKSRVSWKSGSDFGVGLESRKRSGTVLRISLSGSVAMRCAAF
jgi:hypothetical protein